jgi:hypothetical protein
VALTGKTGRLGLDDMVLQRWRLHGDRVGVHGGPRRRHRRSHRPRDQAGGVLLVSLRVNVVRRDPVHWGRRWRNLVLPLSDAPAEVAMACGGAGGRARRVCHASEAATSFGSERGSSEPGAGVMWMVFTCLILMMIWGISGGENLKMIVHW